VTVGLLQVSAAPVDVLLESVLLAATCATTVCAVEMLPQGMLTPVLTAVCCCAFRKTLAVLAP
jgi:hypothetical protein